MLEMVHISILLFDADKDEYSTAMEDLSTCLPLLKSRGMLNIYRRFDVD